MSLLTFDEVWERLQTIDESVEIEAKQASDVGNSILETVSAFANEPGSGGGYLVFGIAERADTLLPDYQIIGVANPDKIQRELSTKCSELFNIPIRPHIITERRQGKTVMLVYIAEAASRDKPVYIKSKGLPKGAYRRISSTDQHCTDDDLALFYQSQGHKAYDETVMTDTSFEDFDPVAIAVYRRVRAEANPAAIELTYTDEDLLDSLCATARHEGRTCATIAGLLLFGTQKALRRHFPMTRVDYIMVPGREWVRDPDGRFHTVEWREALITLIPRIVAYLMEDIPKAFSLAEDAVHRRDTPQIPFLVIRETIVNALMHRSYRQRSPLQIIRYANRIEIRNPGHSLKPDERLGEPGSVARNEKIAAVLHETLFAETKGSGIRSIRNAMKEAQLTPPFFESLRESDEFMVILLPHHLFSVEDRQWLAQFAEYNLSEHEEHALIALRETGAMSNAFYRSLTGLETLAASRSLQKLRDLKLLTQKSKSSATYYVPGERYLASLPQSKENDSSDGNYTSNSQPTEFDSVSNGLVTESNSVGKALLAEMPESLSFAVKSLGRRAMPDYVKTVIRSLCGWREMRLQEIAALLGRNPHWVQRAYLRTMIRDGELVYVFPDDPVHPRQAYRTPKEK